MTDLDALKEDLAYLRERGDLAAALTATTAELHRLIEEVEQLREQRRIDNEEAARIYDFARDKGKALERAAVVAWLRAKANAFDVENSDPLQTMFRCGACMSLINAADDIECGEHRREEER